MHHSAEISHHAIDQFRSRVEPSATRATALRAIREIVTSARSCSKPRKWCRAVGIAARPGARYLYSAARPGICLVMRGNAVVTVFSRTVCAGWRMPISGAGA